MELIDYRVRGVCTPQVCDLPLKLLAFEHGIVCPVPKEIVKLTGLTKLFISGIGLHVLPPEIFQLTKLRCLDLSENFLTAVPKEIRQLTALCKLNLFGNGLRKIDLRGLVFDELLLDYNELEQARFECHNILAISCNPLPSLGPRQLDSLVAEQDLTASFFSLDQTRLDLRNDNPILPIELINSRPLLNDGFFNKPNRLDYYIFV